MNENPCFGAEDFQLAPQEMLLLYTDGLVENRGARDSKRFNRRMLFRFLRRYRSLSPEELQQRLLLAGKALWQDIPPQDDCSLMIICWHGP
jgi:serine phosphatase RsbU (regulator of sigma subunit)